MDGHRDCCRHSTASTRTRAADPSRKDRASRGRNDGRATGEDFECLEDHDLQAGESWPHSSEGARQAEQEWKIAAHSRDMSALSAAPAINVKPVIGGVEIAVRYITRANERYQLRAKLYHAAVDLPGEKNAAHVGAPVGAATK